jgi:hypothetical protein
MGVLILDRSEDNMFLICSHPALRVNWSLLAGMVPKRNRERRL